MADRLYERLVSVGVEVLYDDRSESLGTKFKDADLIGAPIRLTLTPRSLEKGGVEINALRETEGYVVPIEEAVAAVSREISALEDEISRGKSGASVPRRGSSRLPGP